MLQDPQPSLIRSVTMPPERSPTPPPALTTSTSTCDDRRDVDEPQPSTSRRPSTTPSEGDTSTLLASTCSTSTNVTSAVTSAAQPASKVRSRSPTSSLLLNGRSKNETDERKVRSLANSSIRSSHCVSECDDSVIAFLRSRFSYQRLS